MKLYNTVFVIGCDEVGRGPLAGPVGVGAVLCLPEFFANDIPTWYNQVQDSKKVNSRLRLHLAREIVSCPGIVSASVLVGAKKIDAVGINKTIEFALRCVLHKVLRLSIMQSPDDTTLSIAIDGKIDYGLKKNFPQLSVETIVQGDQKVWTIAAASIIAKVRRDTYMTNLSQQQRYINYGFDRHKGYGTDFHRQMIAHYGISDQHRKSFCGNSDIW